MRGWDDHARGLCTGHRSRRPMIEVNCPGCNVTIDTEAATWITCPNSIQCGITFNRHTGERVGGKQGDSDETT